MCGSLSQMRSAADHGKTASSYDGRGDGKIRRSTGDVNSEFSSRVTPGAHTGGPPPGMLCGRWRQTRLRPPQRRQRRAAAPNARAGVTRRLRRGADGRKRAQRARRSAPFGISKRANRAFHAQGRRTRPSREHVWHLRTRARSESRRSASRSATRARGRARAAPRRHFDAGCVSRARPPARRTPSAASPARPCRAACRPRRRPVRCRGGSWWQRWSATAGSRARAATRASRSATCCWPCPPTPCVAAAARYTQTQQRANPATRRD